MTAIIRPRKGHDLEADVRACLERSGEQMCVVVMPSGKRYSMWKSHRVDLDLETLQGSGKYLGYEIECIPEACFLPILHKNQQ